MDWTRTRVAALLRERGLSLKRSLGQNYLVDANFLDALARDAEIEAGDQVVEIGSGLGNLTEKLAARAARVWAFEIDERILALCRELLAELPNVTLIQADGADFARHVQGRLKIVSNLPYADWQRIVLAILAAPQELGGCTLMIQSDVYDRLRAAPGTRAYGPMSVLLQATSTLRKLRRAGKGLFLPPGCGSSSRSGARSRPPRGAAGWRNCLPPSFLRSPESRLQGSGPERRKAFKGGD
jgi:16S rRNA (adenine1518-N6/adenine1519-N6)-dimethyltransferase